MPRSKKPGAAPGTRRRPPLDEATIARLDALLPLYARCPGRDATRSDGLRAVILAGLEIEESRARRGAAPPSPEGGGAAT